MYKGATCRTCGKHFSDYRNANRHYRTVHMKEPTAKCDLCHKELKHYHSLNVHKFKVHGIGNISFGKFADQLIWILKRWFSYNLLGLPCLFSGVRVCLECGKEFKGKQARQSVHNHYNRMHVVKPPSKCEICTSEFNHKDDLRKHLKRCKLKHAK